ncbi:MAG: dienelactone hydrolase family protein [Bdellovibrio sp.]|nr:dienelactone hydrolase family protein [Bdellovibrio sp.]
MEEITLSIADGSKMRAYVARSEKKPTAAVIVFQEAFGVNHHIKDLAKRFAANGYLAIAPELYHRTAPAGFTVGYNEFAAVGNHFSAINENDIHDDAQACFDWLTKMENIKTVSTVGHCLGGRVSFIANATLPLACAISYYGGRIAPGYLHLAKTQKSPLLFFWGGLDQHIPNDQIQDINHALTESKKKFTCVQISDADHGFFCDERASYNAVAAREAWALTLQFLKEYNS